MKKLFGFTLAEVLVTLGIIGVVAALTTPALVTNVRRQGYAATLRSTVTDLETAFGNAIATEQADTLFGTSLWTNVPNAGSFNANANINQKRTFVTSLSRYLRNNGAELNLNSITFYTNADTNAHAISRSGGTGAVTTLMNDGTGLGIPIKLKNGAVMFIRMFSDNAVAREGAEGHDGGNLNAADIFVDVNGTSAPNTVGRDIFGFYLTENGELLPCGGTVLFEAGEFDRHWRDNCVPGNLGVNDWGGWSCTGRLVENGYVFDY